MYKISSPAVGRAALFGNAARRHGVGDRRAHRRRAKMTATTAAAAAASAAAAARRRRGSGLTAKKCAPRVVGDV